MDQAAHQDERFERHRRQYRRLLGTEPWLKQRQLFPLPEIGIHGELYHHHADAPVLIFLPGIGTYGELYAEFLGRLCQQGFNVLVLDPPGHGYSSGKRGVYTVEQMDTAVSVAIDRLREEYHGNIGLFGFSIGSLLAISAAEQDDRVQATLGVTLLLPDLPPDMTYWAGWQWTWGSAFFFPHLQVPLGNMVDFLQLLEGHPAADLINDDPLIVFNYPLSTLSSLFNHRCGISRRRYGFQSATLHGDRDEVLPLGYSERVVKYCQHPVELIAVPGGRHMMPWMQTEQLLELSSEWFHRALG